ncbi:hypothetical protein LJC13_04580, partial [Peptostreptococcaceae bacterium OttesenSCG-928-C18]|nr:hypothetical protein [Peptostreptococcaceae bacterium OttesenSCG-928-C18]
YKLNEIMSKLESFNPQKIFKQGYIKISGIKGDIKSIENLDIDEIVKMYFLDGVASARIVDKEKKID